MQRKKFSQSKYKSVRQNQILPMEKSNIAFNDYSDSEEEDKQKRYLYIF